MSELTNSTELLLRSDGDKPLASPGALNVWVLAQRNLLGLTLAISYVVYFMAIYLSGEIATGPITLGLVFGVWLLGCAFVVRAVPHFVASRGELVQGTTLRGNGIDGALAVWGNVGVVIAATLMGDEMRLPLLLGVVFGVVYSGLEFSENRVRQVIVATLVTYVACVLVKAQVVALSPGYELLCAVGLAVQLLCAAALTRAVVRLRVQARARNRQLSQALRRVEELALRDELTGLYNRRHLLDFIDRAIATRERGGPSFALAYCDLDHFKRVNDRFGHECGDRLLCAFADAASASVRSNDLVARLGGEEFVLVLVDADLSTASDIVERLRMRTAGLRVSAAEPGYRVTLSSGLAAHRPEDTVDSILRRADCALYQAKEQGRDQLVTA